MEYDSPLRLLSDPKGAFRAMADKSGDLDILLSLAKQNAQERANRGL